MNTYTYHTALNAQAIRAQQRHSPYSISKPSVMAIFATRREQAQINRNLLFNLDHHNQ